MDLRNEKIGYKIRSAETSKTPYMLVVGKRERDGETVSVRRHGHGVEAVSTVDEFTERVRGEMREELGISGVIPRLLYKYRLRSAYESEMVTTYLVTWDGAITVHPEEISEGRFWTLAEIDAADPAIFTPNFLDELVRYRKQVGTGL